MTATSRILKQLSYLLFLIVIIGGFIFLIGDIRTREVDPTPTPIIFKPIETRFVNFFEASEGDYDFLARIRNPNIKHGTSVLTYIFDFFDEDDQFVGSKSGVTYIMPGQFKYIIESPVIVGEILSRVELSLGDVIWEEVNTLLTSDISLVNIRSDLIEDASNPIDTNLNGIVLNDSDIGFDEVDVAAVFFNKEDEIVGTGRSKIFTLLAGEERSFLMILKNISADDISRFEVEAYTNIFDIRDILN